jgi:hypothetical protein
MPPSKWDLSGGHCSRNKQMAKTNKRLLFDGVSGDIAQRIPYTTSSILQVQTSNIKGITIHKS